MAQVYRYYRHAKVSERKFRQLLRCFALDLTASDTLDAEMLAHERVSYREVRVEYDANGRAAHINGIENIWSQAKRHLRR